MQSAPVINTRVSLKAPRWEIDYDLLKVEKKIGEGAYGVVFLGKWRNTAVAIKTLRENNNLSEAEMTDFVKEAELMM